VRLERTKDGNGARAELSLGRGTVHVLRPAQIAKLAIWILELFPEYVIEAIHPKSYPTMRTDEPDPEAT
jgi:hypothetical protein